jgi:hypothetical protein
MAVVIRTATVLCRRRNFIVTHILPRLAKGRRTKKSKLQPFRWKERRIAISRSSAWTWWSFEFGKSHLGERYGIPSEESLQQERLDSMSLEVSMGLGRSAGHSRGEQDTRLLYTTQRRRRSAVRIAFRLPCFEWTKRRGSVDHGLSCLSQNLLSFSLPRLYGPVYQTT